MGNKDEKIKRMTKRVSSKTILEERLMKVTRSRDKMSALIPGLPETLPGTLERSHHSTAWFSFFNTERPRNMLLFPKTFRYRDNKISGKEKLLLSLHKLVEK